MKMLAYEGAVMSAQVLEAIIPLATSDISCTCDGASAIVYLQ